MGTVRLQGEHFMVTIQNYVRAKSLEEAYELNQKKGNCILGGMLWTKMQNRMIQTAIDLCDLGLNEIEETEEEFCDIGRTPPENDECKGLEYYEED